MKLLAALAVALGASNACVGQTDGGGRDVSVALFSALPPRRVMVSAAGAGAWWAVCATCTHHSLTTPLHLPAMREIVAGGPLTIRDEQAAQSRTANGRWHLSVTDQGHVDSILTIPSERYVAAVLMGETLANEPPESLRAMAVIARTYVLRLPPSTGPRGSSSAETCDSTACQVMKLGPVSAPVEQAVRDTAGETLWFGKRRAEVFFSESCGGVTEDAGALWPKLSSMSYLRTKADPYCTRADRAAWHGEVQWSQMQEVSRAERWQIPARPISARVAERTASLRARTVMLTGPDGVEIVISAPVLRLAVGRVLGWNIVRSEAYELHLRGDILVFDGRGHGHGVGLCQRGAMEMARLGKSYRDILGFYFPGTAVRITQTDNGWRRTSDDGISFSSTALLTQTQKAAAAEAWAKARSRFSPTTLVIPAVTFAPTTELFRQLTHLPGWQVASTSGSAIALQPAAVLVNNKVSLEAALLHEMLHVATESSADIKAPLWLREGLVEVLAGDASTELPTLSPNDTDRLLMSPSSWQQSREAHRAAGARVHSLVERYGMSAVRGWLIAGSSVPSN